MEGPHKDHQIQLLASEDHTKSKPYVWGRCPNTPWTTAAWCHAHCPGQPVPGPKVTMQFNTSPALPTTGVVVLAAHALSRLFSCYGFATGTLSLLTHSNWHYCAFQLLREGIWVIIQKYLHCDCQPLVALGTKKCLAKTFSYHLHQNQNQVPVLEAQHRRTCLQTKKELAIFTCHCFQSCGGILWTPDLETVLQNPRHKWWKLLPAQGTDIENCAVCYCKTVINWLNTVSIMWMLKQEQFNDSVWSLRKKQTTMTLCVLWDMSMEAAIVCHWGSPIVFHLPCKLLSREHLWGVQRTPSVLALSAVH